MPVEVGFIYNNGTRNRICNFDGGVLVNYLQCRGHLILTAGGARGRKCGAQQQTRPISSLAGRHSGCEHPVSGRLRLVGVAATRPVKVNGRGSKNVTARVGPRMPCPQR